MTPLDQLQVFQAMHASPNARLEHSAQLGDELVAALWNNRHDARDYEAPSHHTLSCYLSGGTGTFRREQPGNKGAPDKLCILPAEHQSAWIINGEIQLAHLYIEQEQFALGAVALLDREAYGGTITHYPRRKLVMTGPIDLPKYGKVSRGRLGVAIQGLDAELAQNFGLDKPVGALVASVENGSPAEKAGLAPGDVVLGVNGQKVDNSADLPRIIGEQKPGSVVRLSIWRDRKARDINVTLGEQAGEKLTAMGGAERKGESASGKLGLTGRALTAQEASRLGVPGGVVVEGLSGPAAKSGLQPGDVIIGVNNQPITGIEQFRKLLDAAGNRFALLIQRGGSRIFLPVRIG